MPNRIGPLILLEKDGGMSSTRGRHDMEALSALLVFVGESTGDRWIPPTKGQWCGALGFYLLLSRTCCSTNSKVIGDLRHINAHATPL